MQPQMKDQVMEISNHVFFFLETGDLMTKDIWQIIVGQKKTNETAALDRKRISWRKSVCLNCAK